MSSIRSRKETFGNLDANKKFELVQGLRTERLKREQALAAAREARLKRQAGNQVDAAYQPPSKPLKLIVDRVKRNDPTLKTLNFSVGVWWLSGPDIDSLSEALMKNTRVTEVNFHGNSLGPEGASALADALVRNRTVETLNLAANKVTDDGMLPLAELMGSETCSLQSLILLSNNISDVGALDFFPSLASNTSLQKLDLSGNGISSIGGTSLAESLSSNSTMTEVLLSHNALSSEGVERIRDALKENWTMTKLDLSGNHFEEDLKSQISDLLQRNIKLRNLNMLKSGNEEELKSLSSVAPPPPDAEGKPARFAHEIDIVQTDPRLMAATQTGKDLMLQAAVAENNVLTDRACAVVHVTTSGSCRGLLAMSKLVAEGESAALAVAHNNGIPVLVDLIAVEVGTRGGCENPEALKHAVNALLAIARAGAEEAEQIIKFMAIGPLTALLDIQRLRLSRMLETLDAASAIGPLSVVEASWKSTWMATMAAAIACVCALAEASVKMAVPAAVAERCMDKLRALSSGSEDEDRQELSLELRVQAIEAIAQLGRYDAALHRMEGPMAALVQGVASGDEAIAMAANRALLRLLDEPALSALPRLVPEEEGVVDVFGSLSAWFVEAEGIQITAERLLEAAEEEARVAALLLLSMTVALPVAHGKVTKAGGKNIIFCLLQVLLSDEREDCLVNSLWVLGVMLDRRAVLQRTLCQHDGAKLLVKLCKSQHRHPRSQVAGHSAWLLGVMSQDATVCGEVVKAGAVEMLVDLVLSHPTDSQGRLAGNSLVRLVETSEEARRRAKRCDAFDAFVRLSQDNSDPEVVAGAVSGISCLTHDTIADRISYTEDGQVEVVPRADRSIEVTTAMSTHEEEDALSIAARYLSIEDEDEKRLALPGRRAPETVSLLPPDSKPSTGNDESRKPLPTVSQARRELRAKLLKQRLGQR